MSLAPFKRVVRGGVGFRCVSFENGTESSTRFPTYRRKAFVDLTDNLLLVSSVFNKTIALNGLLSGLVFNGV